MDGCQVYLFGPPHVTRHGQPVTIPRRKQWGLLAYLLLTRQPHERDALAALLWPAYSQERARADLRRELARLHRLLPDLLLTTHATVALAPPGQLWVDVWAFEEHLTSVNAHAHRSGEACVACLEHLRAASALYVDDLLAGCTLPDNPEFEEWLFFQQESVRGWLLDALGALAQMEMANGNLSQAIPPLRQRLAIDPLDEESHRQLIWLYVHTGQRAAALRQFQKCQEVLANELGADPSVETLALFRQIAQAPATRAAEPGPEQGAPTTRAAPVFVGRDRQLAQLRGHLAAACDGQGHVAFVAGEAGSGKTALLSQFARQALSERRDLIVAGGCGTTPYGAGGLLLPFRDLFAMLTCDFECEWVESMPAGEQTARLRGLLPWVVHALVTLGPHLLGNLVTGSGLLARAGEVYLAHMEDYEQLRSLVNARREWGGEGETHHLIFAEVGAVLHALAARHPLLLLLDNLQWADPLSFDLLFHLGKRLGAQPILIVGAYRPDEIAPDDSARGGRSSLPAHHPLVALTHEFARDFGAVQVDLDEAPQAEAKAWLDALLQAEGCTLPPVLRDALFALTRGHPLFTCELLHLWREQGWLRRSGAGVWVAAAPPDLSVTPLKVAAAILRRLDRLSEEAVHVLAVASVEGEVFTVARVAAALGWSERRTLELVAAELHHRHRLVAEVAAADGLQYRFVQPMMRNYLYQQLDESERRLLRAILAPAA